MSVGIILYHYTEHEFSVAAGGSTYNVTQGGLSIFGDLFRVGMNGSVV